MSPLKRLTTSVKLTIAIGAAVAVCGCSNIFVPEESGGVPWGQDEEREFCWWMLSYWFLYQEAVPEHPYVYDTPQAMYRSVGDRYTWYVPPDSSEWLFQQLTTRSGGIGIMLDSVSNGLLILDVFSNSPGEEAGLQEGDTITSVDGTNLGSLSFDASTDLLGGDMGDEQTFGIKRDTSNLTIVIVLGTYYAPAVHTDSLDSATAYIALTTFSDSTEGGGSAEEFRAALSTTSWADFTVLDLRHNGGGLVSQCLEICGEFVSDTTLVYSSEERQLNSSGDGVITAWADHYSGKSGNAVGRRFYVLVDGYSASASEVLLAFLMSLNSSDITVVGTTTFGKGSAWTYFPTPREGIAIMTISENYKPNGDSYNTVGIVPDIQISSDDNALDIALGLIGSSALTKRLAQSDGRVERIRSQLRKGDWMPLGVRRPGVLVLSD